MGEFKKKTVVFVAGVFIGLLFFGSFQLISGNSKTIRNAEKVEEQLRASYRGVEEALGITRNSIQSVDGLVAVIDRQRQAVEDSTSALNEAHTALSEIGTILIGSADIIDRLLEWAEKNGL